MKLAEQMPDVADNSRYTVTAAAKLLGMERTSLYRRIKHPRRGMEIKTIISRLDGKLKIEGREIKRIWYACY